MSRSGSPAPQRHRPMWPMPEAVGSSTGAKIPLWLPIGIALECLYCFMSFFAAFPGQLMACQKSIISESKQAGPMLEAAAASAGFHEGISEGQSSSGFWKKLLLPFAALGATESPSSCHGAPALLWARLPSSSKPSLLASWGTQASGQGAASGSS